MGFNALFQNLAEEQPPPSNPPTSNPQPKPPGEDYLPPPPQPPPTNPPTKPPKKETLEVLLNNKIFNSPYDYPATVQIIQKSLWVRRRDSERAAGNVREEGTFIVFYPVTDNGFPAKNQEGWQTLFDLVPVSHRYFTRKTKSAEESVVDATEENANSPSGLEFQYGFWGSTREAALENRQPVFTEKPQTGAPPGHGPFWQITFLSYKQLFSKGLDIYIYEKQDYLDEVKRTIEAQEDSGIFQVLYAQSDDKDAHNVEKKYDPENDDFQHANNTRIPIPYHFVQVRGGSQNKGFILATEDENTHKGKNYGTYYYDRARLPFAEFALDQAKRDAERSARDAKDKVSKLFDFLGSWDGILIFVSILGGGLLALVIILKIIS